MAMTLISIHALCEEGDLVLTVFLPSFHPISIHALCEEGDARVAKPGRAVLVISIHALCEEGDYILLVKAMS